MSKSSAKDKIQKLLNLANRPGTPEEGETALLHAMALAEKHGLTIRRKPPVQKTRARRTYRRTASEQATWEAWRDEQRRKAERERKRKMTTYRKAYNRGQAAAAAGLSEWSNPYDKWAWGVNLPSAWRSGWYDYQDDLNEQKGQS